MSLARQLIEGLLLETPAKGTLEKHKQQLSSEERQQLKDAGCAPGAATVWKATVDGQTYYVAHTHRAGLVRSSLQGIIAVYDEVAATG